jgi:hypothetical protein
MLAIRFVPNRSNLDALFGEHLKRSQLRFRLMSKPITNTK